MPTNVFDNQRNLLRVSVLPQEGFRVPRNWSEPLGKGGPPPS